MKVSSKLSKEQLDKYAKEYYLKVETSFISISIIVLILYAIVTLLIKQWMMFFIGLFIIIFIDFIFILVMKVQRNKMVKLCKKNNKNYTYIFNEDLLTIKSGFEKKEYEYYNLEIFNLKSFLRIESEENEIYIIPKKELSKKDIKEINIYFE